MEVLLPRIQQANNPGIQQKVYNVVSQALKDRGVGIVQISSIQEESSSYPKDAKAAIQKRRKDVNLRIR